MPKLQEKKQHQISVCMATYNGERFIGQQLSSILCQLGYNDELIISDDGSSDTTCTIITSFNDDRIKLFYNPNSRGPVRNFEYALQHAQGEYIFLADQDDIWFKDKVALVTRLLQSSDMVVTDCTLVDADGVLLKSSFFEQYGSGTGFLSNLISNSYLGCCMAFRRSLLEKALPIPLSVPMHDIWLGLLAEWYCRPCFYPESLMAYRRHDATASTTGARSNRSFWQKINSRYHLVVCLVRRIVALRFGIR